MNQTTKLNIYRQAREWLEQNGYEAEVRDDYSGRGMMGDSCPAIVTDAPGTVVGFAVGIACTEDPSYEDPYWDIMEMIPARSDGMGRDKLVWY